mgnify:CR=1 FL=1
MFWNDKEMDLYYKKLPKHLQKSLDIVSKYCVAIRFEKSDGGGSFRFEGYDTPDFNGVEVFSVNSLYDKNDDLSITIWDPKSGWHWGHKPLKVLEEFMRQNIENKKQYFLNQKLRKMKEDF